MDKILRNWDALIAKLRFSPIGWKPMFDETRAHLSVASLQMVRTSSGDP